MDKFKPGERVDPRLLEGPILPTMLRLAAPITVAFLLQSMYGIIDIIWLGHYGAALGPEYSHVPIAAVTLTRILFFVFFAWTQLFASGTTTLVARAWGAGNYEAGRNVARQSLQLILVAGLIPAVPAAVFAAPIMRVLGAVGPVADQGAVYLRIIGLGFIFQMMLITVNFAFRGVGDMVSPMKIMILATVVNLVLDPFLIFGWWFFPELGIAGAALATVAAQFSGMTAGLVLINSKNTALALGWKRLFPRPDLQIIRDMIAVGFPVGMQFLLSSASVIAALRFTAGFGPDPEHAMRVTAALGVAAPSLVQTFNMVVVSLSFAVTTLVGQNLGSGSIRRAWKTAYSGLGVTLVWQVMGIALFVSMPQVFLRIFTPDPALVALGVPIIRIFALVLVFTGTSIILGGVFRGAGYTHPSMFGAATKLVTVLALLAILPRFWSWSGIWWSLFFMDMAEALVVLPFFMAGRWTEKKFKSVDNF